MLKQVRELDTLVNQCKEKGLTSDVLLKSMVMKNKQRTEQQRVTLLRDIIIGNVKTAESYAEEFKVSRTMVANYYNICIRKLNWLIKNTVV